MATDIAEYTVTFPEWYDDRAAWEAPSKGHLQGVEVRVGRATFVLTFYDPVRLQQTLEDDAEAGRPYFSEPGLVVLPEVTTAAVLDAVAGLHRDGRFSAGGGSTG